MLKKLTSNLGLKLISLVAAFVVWLVVVNVDDPVSTRSYSQIKVNIANENVILEQGKAYEILENSDIITVTVKAKRSILDSLSSSDFQAVADMKEANIELGLVPIEVTSTRSANKIEEITTRTKNLKVSIEDYTSKQFPVTADIIGNTMDGYAVDQVNITPNVIKISGPVSSLAKIARVVVRVDVDGMASDMNISAKPTLLDANDKEINLTGLVINNEELGVNVTMTKTKMVPINIRTTGSPENGWNVVSMECNPKEIYVKGNQKILDAFDKIDIPAYDLNGRTESIQERVDLTKFLPDGVEIADSSKEEASVSVIIEKIDEVNYTLSTSKIKTKNMTMGLVESFADEKFTFTIKGSADNIAKLTDASFTCEIDLGNYTKAGEYKVPVKVTAPKDIEITKEITVDVIIALEEQ